MFYFQNRIQPYPIRSDLQLESLFKETCYLKLQEIEEIPSSEPGVLLLNPYTATWCFVNSDELKIIHLLKNGTTYPQLEKTSTLTSESGTKDFLQHLFLRGMMAVNGESALPQDIYKDGPLFEKAYLIEILLSEACNLSCKYCFAEPNKASPPMSKEVAMLAINKAMELPAEELSIEFGGGETFLCFEIFASLVEEIREKASRSGKEVQILVQTNGTLLHKHKMMEFLVKNNIHVGLSMDGPPEVNDLSRPYSNGRGSTKDILKCIKLFNHFGLKNLPFLTVINRYNVHCAEKVVDYFLSLGSHLGMFLSTLKLGAAIDHWDDIGIEPYEFFGFMKQMVEHSREDRHFECLMIKRMLDNLTKPTRDFRCMRSPCGAGLDYIVVDSKGDVYPCSHHVHRKELRMGNIADSIPLHLYALQNGFLKEMFIKRRVRNIPQCSRCPWRHFCESGCALDSYYHYAHLLGPSTLCGYYKKMYPFLLQFCFEHPDVITQYMGDEAEIISF